MCCYELTYLISFNFLVFKTRLDVFRACFIPHKSMTNCPASGGRSPWKGGEELYRAGIKTKWAGHDGKHRARG